MADIEYSGELHAHGDGSPVVTGGIGRIFNVAGAVASLALIAGIGVWGFKLMVRDVSGVPVVRALEGPMREQPEDPGGRQADHQGLAVNRVAAEGTAAAPADRLVLAPRPMELDDEDKPMGVIAPQPAVLLQENAVTPRPASDAAVMEALADAVAGGDAAKITPASMNVTTPVQQALAAADPGETGAGDQASSVPSTDEETGELAGVTPAVVTGPGPARSLRPVPRPARAVAGSSGAGGGSTMASAITAAVDTVAGLEVDATDLPQGTRLAQLGAYESAEIARSEWDRLTVRFEDYMVGKQRVVQEASSGGRTFWRLRAMGFEDLSDARRFCSALMAENADCIAVTVR